MLPNMPQMPNITGGHASASNKAAQDTAWNSGGFTYQSGVSPWLVGGAIASVLLFMWASNAKR